jgi:hypothetical protein
MTTDEALVAVHAVEGLLAHPGWTLIASRWEESEREYDEALHRERVDDVVRMQICQTTCRVLREVLETPGKLVRELREMVEG